MAASGFTPISLYYSSTASSVPLAANLTDGELALNTNDMKLYAKNSSGVVTLLASNAGASGTVSSVAVSGGTTGLTTSGGPITTSGTITIAGTLATTNGGTNLTSFTSGGAMYATSTSALTTGTLPVTAGGTGLTTLTAGYIPFGNGTSAFGSGNGLYWDNTNGRLGVNSGGTPIVALQVSSTANYIAGFKSSIANGFISLMDSGTSGIFTDGNVGIGAITNDLAFRAGGATRMRLNSNGAIAINATADYGTSGQVLTSAGSGAAPTWSTPTGISTGKSIAMAMIFGF